MSHAGPSAHQHGTGSVREPGLRETGGAGHDKAGIAHAPRRLPITLLTFSEVVCRVVGATETDPTEAAELADGRGCHRRDDDPVTELRTRQLAVTATGRDRIRLRDSGTGKLRGQASSVVGTLWDATLPPGGDLRGGACHAWVGGGWPWRSRLATTARTGSSMSGPTTRATATRGRSGNAAVAMANATGELRASVVMVSVTRSG